MWTILFDNRANQTAPAVICSETTTSWGELQDLARQAEDVFRPLAAARVGLVCRGSASCYAALAALDRVASNAFLLDASKTEQELQRLARTFELDFLVRSDDRSRSWSIDSLSSPQHSVSSTSHVTILTSGTTGVPKAVTHTWESLGHAISNKRLPGNSRQVWLLAYRPQLYAGLQVALHAFSAGGTLVVPAARSSPLETVDLMLASGVQFVSATPSFWRHLLLHLSEKELQGIPIVQITLGGERVDQGLLDQLTQIFPDARLTHIYATTELGKCFSVTDRRAGFPLDYVGRTLPGDIQLKIERGHLYARSANRMVGYDRATVQSPRIDEEWIDTGDLVEVEADRVYFAGRESEFINVGGYKVNPIKVEEIIRRIDGIRDVRVYGKDSSITGQIVACDVVLTENSNEGEVTNQIRTETSAQLDRFHLPRFINVVDAIPLSDAGKVKRS